MPDFEQRALVEGRLLELSGGDPFAAIARAAEAHRPSHGSDCGLFSAGPHVMRLVATLARSSRPKRVLDLGCGFGYSTLWLATACGTDALVQGIDRFPEHVARAEAFARDAGFADRVRFTVGEVSRVLGTLQGPYDWIHDDAWFAAEPSYKERAVQLLRPGGTLTMPNWFLLEDAISGEPRRDWSEFAGPGWRASTLAYAERLAGDPRLFTTWSTSPPLAIAVKEP